MSGLITILKWLGGPGSIGFLLLCLTIPVVLALRSRHLSRGARAWLALVLSSYGMGSVPAVANAFVDALPPSARATSFAGATQQMLIVFGGDNPNGRARYAFEVFTALQPKCVQVSGGRWFVRKVTAAGIPADRITSEQRTATTREQASEVQSWMTACGSEMAVVIASRVAAPRVAALLRRTGANALLASAPLDYEPAKWGVRRFIPSYGALMVTRDAIYEHAALAYYRRRGWID